MRRSAATAAAALLLTTAAGCAGAGAEDDPDDTSTPTPTASPSPSATPTAAPMPTIISVDATSATVTLPFSLSAEGTAATPHGDVSFTADVGTIELGGAARVAALYEEQPWEDAGYTLYQGLAIGPSSWEVFWLYCQGTTLAYVWVEGVNGPAMEYVGASGTCTDAGATTDATVSFPAVSLTVPPSVPGYTITGGDMVLEDGETGTVRIGAKTLPFVVFEDVDCTACADPGWYELHSLLWDEDEQRATFVIFYLDLGYPDTVFAAYARSLPDFGDPVGDLALAGTWSAPPPGTSFAPAFPLPRPLPPSR